MSENTKDNKKEKGSFMKKYGGMAGSIALCLVMLIVAIVILLVPQKEEEPVHRVEFSGIEDICELATIKAYYHNVAEEEQQPNGLFKYGLFQFGYKKMWIEYYGIAEMGIKANKVVVCEPDDKNVVRIYVPEAEILSISIEDDSIGELLHDEGVFTKITIEEQASMVAAAQQAMEEKIVKEGHLFEQAYFNAKKILEKYVINLGQQFGEEYTVEWLDEAPTEQEGTDEE